jgi:hypothetical protein
MFVISETKRRILLEPLHCPTLDPRENPQEVTDLFLNLGCICDGFGDFGS